MTAPFVTNLRSRTKTIRLAPTGTDAITVRVEMAEVWDVVRLEVLASDQVLEVKKAALEVLYPSATILDEFVMKLNGWEILDETVSLTDAGAIDGSILLVTFRRRRPIK